MIMDDSDGEETQERLAQLHDERVRVVRTPARRGAVLRSMSGSRWPRATSLLFSTTTT